MPDRQKSIGAAVKAVSVLLKALGSSSRTLSPPGAAGFKNGWLFASASRPVLIAEHSTGIIIEANPAAAALLDIERIHMIGMALTEVFAQSSQSTLMQAVALTRTSGRAKLHGVRARCAGTEVAATLSTVRAGTDTYLLICLDVLPLRQPHQGPDEGPSIVLDMIQDSQEGFLLTDLGLRITYANPAFASLAGEDSVGDLIDQPLAVWLELSITDLARLHEKMSSREAAYTWMSMLRQRNGTLRPVEITAVPVPEGEDACWGFRVAAPSRSYLEQS